MANGLRIAFCLGEARRKRNRVLFNRSCEAGGPPASMIGCSVVRALPLFWLFSRSLRSQRVSGKRL